MVMWKERSAPLGPRHQRAAVHLPMENSRKVLRGILAKRESPVSGAKDPYHLDSNM